MDVGAFTPLQPTLLTPAKLYLFIFKRVHDWSRP